MTRTDWLSLAATVVGLLLMGGWAAVWPRVRRTRAMRRWRRQAALVADGALRAPDALRTRRSHWRGR